jgi:MazG family protein
VTPGLKRLQVSRLAVPKNEVASHTEHPRPESVNQIFAQECFRCERGELPVEARNEHHFNADAFDKAELLIESADQSRRLTGSQYSHRMRVERQDRRADPKLASSLHDSVKNSLVPEMEAVKVADGQYAGTVLRCIRQLGNHFHRVMIIRMTGAKFEKLVEIMATLRGPNGCPWDKQQDRNTLKPMLVEETYEVLEAIDNNDPDGLSEELGDLLLHVVFQAQLGKEDGGFDIDKVIDGICDKLVRRHPHVFGNDTASSPEEVIKNWEAIKAQEKTSKLKDRTPEQRSLLEGIPSKLPAIHEAHQISSRAARVGFEWPDIEGVFDKLEEETHELREAMTGPEDSRQSRLEDEIGDILFVIVNLARFLKIDSESALKRANRKFKARFQYMEAELAKAGKTLDETALDEMESLWQKAKSQTTEP